MKIIVTGGCGFIGTNLVHQLALETMWDVVVIDKMSYANQYHKWLPEVRNKVKLYPLDLCHKDVLTELVKEIKPAGILHLAAESHVDNSIVSPDPFINSNIIGTYNLLEASRSYYSSMSIKDRAMFRLLHVSTDEVFGSLTEDDPPFSETTPYAPNSPYSSSKAGSDFLVRAWYHTYKLPVIITNCSNNYGPWQHPEKLIPKVITNATSGKNIPVYGNGKNIRDWIYVGDHVAGIMAAFAKGTPGHSYLLGANSPKRNMEIIDTILSTLEERCPGQNIRDLVTHVTDRAGHDWRYEIDNTRAVRELGWEPKVDFQEGIKRTIDWYLNN